MADKQKYRVMRRHEGDRLYEAGEIREISDADATHLVGLGVLKKDGAKADHAPANKAELRAPRNKGA